MAAALLVLLDLSWEIELKEPMSEHVTEYIYYALKRCKLDGTIQIFGCAIFYSLCYRSESGQEFVLTGDSTGLLKCIRENHGGDTEVEYAARRLELALKFDGWRGNIEQLMNMEIRGKKIPAKYLKQSPHERRFPPDNKFPLEEAEDERNHEIDEVDRLKFEAAKRAKEEEAYRKERAAKAKAEKQAAKAAKDAMIASKSLKATDMNGDTLQPISLQDAYENEEAASDDIMQAIAKMEVNIAEYKDEVERANIPDNNDFKNISETKGDRDDDEGSIISKLSFAEENEISSPWGSVANSPRTENVIQTPLHLSKKALKPDFDQKGKDLFSSSSVDRKGEDEQVDSTENMKTQEAYHSMQAGEAESKSDKDAERGAKDEK